MKQHLVLTWNCENCWKKFQHNEISNYRFDRLGKISYTLQLCDHCAIDVREMVFDINETMTEIDLPDEPDDYSYEPNDELL